jgi:hypothetical protein
VGWMQVPMVLPAVTTEVAVRQDVPCCSIAEPLVDRA